MRRGGGSSARYNLEAEKKEEEEGMHANEQKRLANQRNISN